MKRRIGLASAAMSSSSLHVSSAYQCPGLPNSRIANLDIYASDASETWTLILAADRKKTGSEVPKPNIQDPLFDETQTGLRPALDPIVRRRNSLFGHVARLPEDTPAHQALRCHIDLSLGRGSSPRSELEAMTRRFSEQAGTTIHFLLTSAGDEPSRVERRGHYSTLRSSLTTR